MEDYPRSSNAEWLKTPQLGKQVAASIPKRSNNYDKKLKQTQMCVGAALTASTRVLQGLMEKANEDESLVALGRQAVDALALGAYVHSDINTIRKGAIRQVVNPNYVGVFTRHTNPTPESLLGENSVPEQIKEFDEINKVRAKLQKNKKGQDVNRSESFRGRGRGFGSEARRGGFHGRQNSGGSNNNNNFGQQNQGFYQRGSRGGRGQFPQQRRVYGNQTTGTDQNYNNKNH